MREQVVTLAEVTADTLGAIIELDVAPEQRGFVASNAVSIAEAHFKKGAWFRAIEADGAPVGFVMLFDPTLPGATVGADDDPGDILLWRLMIDRRFQRSGIGRKALDQVVVHARARPGAKRLVSSFGPGESGPGGFYLRYGFTKTGAMNDDGTEVEIAYPL